MHDALLPKCFDEQARILYRLRGRLLDFSMPGGVARFKHFHDRCYWTQHLVSPHIVEIDGDGARASTPVHAVHVQIRDDGNAQQLADRRGLSRPARARTVGLADPGAHRPVSLRRGRFPRKRRASLPDAAIVRMNRAVPGPGAEAQDAIRIRSLHTIGEPEIRGLSDVLIDCVEGGASVSFMFPMSLAKAEAFWRGAVRERVPRRASRDRRRRRGRNDRRHDSGPLESARESAAPRRRRQDARASTIPPPRHRRGAARRGRAKRPRRRQDAAGARHREQ